MGSDGSEERDNMGPLRRENASSMVLLVVNC